MIGEMGPGLIRQRSRAADARVADINPVEPKERETGGKGFGRAAVGLREYLFQTGFPQKQGVGALAPVVEIAGHHQRRIVRQSGDMLA